MRLGRMGRTSDSTPYLATHTASTQRHQTKQQRIELLRLPRKNEPTSLRSTELGGEFTDQGMADFGNPTVAHGIEAEATETRNHSKVSGPRRGDNGITGDQGLDVVSDHAPSKLDGLLVIIRAPFGPRPGGVWP